MLRYVSHPPLRRRAIACALILAAGLTALAIWSRPGPAAAGSTAIPPGQAARLRAAMLRVARADGDPRPASMLAVATTRKLALTDATPGDTIPGSARQQAYLVVMTGRFSTGLASVPPGAKLPATQRYLALSVDPATLTATDAGVSNQPPPVRLSDFGVVSNLLAHR